MSVIWTPNDRQFKTVFYVNNDKRYAINTKKKKNHNKNV